MNSPISSLSQMRASAQTSTPLIQLCGTNFLFRDRYKILQALGRGGFGVAFLAKEVVLPGEPECVIKQLCPKTTNPVILQRASERFEREAKILGQLGSHAHIPRLLDYFQIDGEFYLVQEYIRGVNLAKEVRLAGPLYEYGVQRFLREILPVVDYIHRNQVIHRDIKPPNIIRCQDDGRLVLIDFGAVREEIAEITETSLRCQTTQFVGTMGFAPPEQLSLRPVYASDIYALGVTCLYLLTGRSPMEFETDPRTGEIQWQEIVQVSSYFAKILTKMLKISPCDRYQSAAQVLRALELEPYLDNLADCMNTQPRVSHLIVEKAEEPDAGAYLTPAARQAVEIRNWRSRLQAKQQKQPGWSSDDHLIANSSCLS